jgi:hypothetical protein
MKREKKRGVNEERTVGSNVFLLSGGSEFEKKKYIRLFGKFAGKLEPTSN